MLRNSRYCELLVLRPSGESSLVVDVYNSTGVGYCSDACVASWSTDLLDNVRGQVSDAIFVEVNGPRNWLMDKIEINPSDVMYAKTLDVCVKMRYAASLPYSGPVESYGERSVQRNTKWIYKAGLPVFRLKGPRGEKYIMQSYTTMVDSSLSYQALHELGESLQLPEGWKYQVITPDVDLVVESVGGLATIVQDEKKNTYQKYIESEAEVSEVAPEVKARTTHVIQQSAKLNTSKDESGNPFHHVTKEQIVGALVCGTAALTALGCGVWVVASSCMHHKPKRRRSKHEDDEEDEDENEDEDDVLVGRKKKTRGGR